MKIRRIRIGVSFVMCFILLVACTSFANTKQDPMANYKKQIVQLKSQIQALVKTSMESQKKSKELIEKNNKEIIALKEKITALESSVSEKEQNNSRLQDQMNTLSKTITELQTLADTQTSLIKTLQEQQLAQNATILELQNKLLSLAANSGSNSAGSASTAYPLIPDYNSDMTIKINADPSKGFHYSYFLYIPQGISKTEHLRLLVEPNNTGHPTTDTSELEKNAYDMASIYNSHSIAQKLSIPLLIPTFPRTYEVYTHDLGRTTIEIKDGSLKRIDMQLKAMIRDALKYLSANNIKMEDKVFLNGFSASSHFANRFALMYPEMVRAVATGGINSLPIIPAKSVNGTTLRFPIGISDLTELTGINFNMDAYKKVTQFVYMGEKDANDTAKASDCFEDQDRTVIYGLLGQTMTPDRFTKVQQIFKDLGLTDAVQFHVYAGIGHEQPGYVWEDLTAFFKNNMNDVTKPFTPHQ